MKKIIIGIAVFVFLLFGVLTALRLFVGGGEDTWICVEGQWVEHGHPKVAKPQSGCEDKADKVQKVQLEERLRTLKNNLHAVGSGTEAKKLFPDLSPVYVDNGHGNPQIPQQILPFTYYYSQEADITISICNINQTVFICPGKLTRLIQAKDYNNCQVAKEYLQIGE